jgi:uncharacterized RmlC-like cupin family protein
MGHGQGTAVAGTAAEQFHAEQEQQAQQAQQANQAQQDTQEMPAAHDDQASQASRNHPGLQRGSCVVIRPDAVPDELGGLTLTTGISRDTVGSRALCMHLVMLLPGTRGTPHFHSGHESAIWVAMGEAEIWHGPGLCGRTVVHAGDFLYIPAGVPHLPVNRSEDEMMVAVVARTDPAERESVVVFDLPAHLDGLFAVPVATAM